MIAIQSLKKLAETMIVRATASRKLSAGLSRGARRSVTEKA